MFLGRNIPEKTCEMSPTLIKNGGFAMKYLIISRGAPLGAPQDAAIEHLNTVKEKIQAGIDQGKLDAVYALVSGGSVWVVNAESHEALAQGLRKWKLPHNHDVEVHPIVDVLERVDHHISQLTTT
jgi:hypothetical protein